MRRHAVVVAAFIVVVAMTIGTSAGQPPSEHPMWRTTVPANGSDDSPLTRDVVTQVIASGANHLQFYQASSDGLFRRVSIKWTSSAGPGPSADDHEIVLDDGRRFLVQRPLIGTDPVGLVIHLSFNFFLPRESLPRELLDPAKDPDRSALATAARMIAEALSTAAQAAGGDGLSGEFSSTFKPIVQVVREHTNDPRIVEQRLAGEEMARALENDEKMEKWAKELEEKLLGKTISTGECTDPNMLRLKDWIRRMQELNRKAAELGEGWIFKEALEASPEYREIRAAREAMMREAMIKKSLTGSSSAASAAAHQGAQVGASHSGRGMRGLDIAFAAIQLKTILEEQIAFKERVAALRRCHQNPTHPLAQKAKADDPAYESVEKALDAVDFEVDAVSAMREGAASLNAGAGSDLPLVGGIMTGLMGEVEDSLLKERLEESLASIEKCVVRCTCAGKPDLQPANSPEPNFTPAQEEPNFTPAQEKPFTQGPVAGQYTKARPAEPPPPGPVCRPLSHAFVKYTHFWDGSGCVGGTWCSTTTETRVFSASADLKYVEESGHAARYEGSGTGRMGEVKIDNVNPTPGCPQGKKSEIVTEGHGAVLFTAGFADGETQSQSSSPEDTVTVDLAVQQVSQGDVQECGEDKSFTNQNNDIHYSCDFYNVDLTGPGIYVVPPAIADGSGSCTLMLY